MRAGGFRLRVPGPWLRGRCGPCLPGVPASLPRGAGKTRVARGGWQRPGCATESDLARCKKILVRPRNGHATPPALPCRSTPPAHRWPERAPARCRAGWAGWSHRSASAAPAGLAVRAPTVRRCAASPRGWHRVMSHWQALPQRIPARAESRWRSSAPGLAAGRRAGQKNVFRGYGLPPARTPSGATGPARPAPPPCPACSGSRRGRRPWRRRRSRPALRC